MICLIELDHIIWKIDMIDYPTLENIETLKMFNPRSFLSSAIRKKKISYKRKIDLACTRGGGYLKRMVTVFIWQPSDGAVTDKHSLALWLVLFSSGAERWKENRKRNCSGQCGITGYVHHNQTKRQKRQYRELSCNGFGW